MHWADALQLPPTAQDAERLRQATLAGLPLGESEFVEDLEQAFARRLLPGRPGRKPKTAADWFGKNSNDLPATERPVLAAKGTAPGS
jgi:hypothetical protein